MLQLTKAERNQLDNWHLLIESKRTNNHYSICHTAGI